MVGVGTKFKFSVIILHNHSRSLIGRNGHLWSAWTEYWLMTLSDEILRLMPKGELPRASLHALWLMHVRRMARRVWFWPCQIFSRVWSFTRRIQRIFDLQNGLFTYRFRFCFSLRLHTRAFLTHLFLMIGCPHSLRSRKINRNVNWCSFVHIWVRFLENSWRHYELPLEIDFVSCCFEAFWYLVFVVVIVPNRVHRRLRGQPQGAHFPRLYW